MVQALLQRENGWGVTPLVYDRLAGSGREQARYWYIVGS